MAKFFLLHKHASSDSTQNWAKDHPIPLVLYQSGPQKKIASQIWVDLREAGANLKTQIAHPMLR